MGDCLYGSKFIGLKKEGDKMIVVENEEHISWQDPFEFLPIYRFESSEVVREIFMDRGIWVQYDSMYNSGKSYWVNVYP